KERLVSRDAQPIDQPADQPRARPEKEREHHRDRQQRDRYRQERNLLRTIAEDRDAERQRDEIREEDTRRSDHLLDQRRRRNLDGAAGEARGVIELVAVEPDRRGEERAEKSADQERAEDVPEGKRDALAAQQHRPAVHAGEDAQELDQGGEEHEAQEHPE